jgi:dTDP-4-amino-4,6-dideoxygalactose transaminase
MSTGRIAFNKPWLCGKELEYIAEAHRNARLAGDGPFTVRCHDWLEQRTACKRALLTHSGTAALEMSALLLDIRPGDEIIMPSYTFVSTANAFALRGGVPVFVDIRQDTLNIDEALIEAAITPRTRAVVAVHYAGVACEMDAIVAIAARHRLMIVEDAALGLMSAYKGRMLGSIGHLGACSFHETKNIIAGEGGALLVNEPALIAQAEIIREKGTDRSRFFRGEVDKYTWQEVGSSFLPGELTAAFLLAQLEAADRITRLRIDAWKRYHERLEAAEAGGLLRRPVVPPECAHNGHIYYVLLPADVDRKEVIDALKGMQIDAVFHYVPLHDSPAGRRHGRAHGPLTQTETLSQRLLRLPLWTGISEAQQEQVCNALHRILESAAGKDSRKAG